MASTRLLRSLEKHVSLDKVMRLKNEKLGGNVLGRLSIWKMVLDAVWTGGPGTCHFAITSACNARCGFCSFARDQLPAASRHSVTLAEAKLASDILKRNGVRFLHFTGGEPLVHRDFMAMVSHAAQIGMIPTLVTNGALLTPKRVDALADAGLATVYISIDAASSTVHDSNRGLTGLSARIRRANVALKRRQIPSSASVTMSDDQVAFYDDGVGTSAFKPLALLGGAFGWGLKRNVIHLYTFLCRNYQPGDNIYCFGFSRGAFTIRLITGLVTGEGLVDAPTGKSERVLRREAKFLYRRYRRSRRFTFNYTFVFLLRWLRDWIITMLSRLLRQTTPNQVAIRHRPRVRFLGLWDTVAAYGLPMYEMTRGVDLYFWPISMRDRNLSDRVDRACHALALDDERTTFHPLLWNEKDEPGIFAGPGSQDISRTDQERISQV